MAGMGMQDIKRRIRSVNSTRQITKAMELVSSAKLRKARENLARTRPYFNTIGRTVGEIVTSTRGIQHEFLETREIKRTGYIVISADRGLAGGYNANVIREAVDHMKGRDKVSVITIGQKARDYFRKRAYDLDGEFIHISEDPHYSHAQNIARLAIELYRQELVDEIYLVYTEFVSTINHQPRTIKLLPIESTEIEQEDTDKKAIGLMEYEPSPEVVLDYLIPKYIDSMIYGALVEASVSEQGARRVAMESATDNATEMIDDLELQFNRARQASITQEIAEIVGGAEALS